MSTPDGPREKIVNSAGRIFAERGYKSATVRQICQAAEVNVAAVNYYFGDKAGLYLATVKHAHRQLSTQFPMPPWPKETPAAVKLRGFIQAMLTRMIGGKGTAWEQRLMLREVLHPTAACRELVDEYFRPHLELLSSILDALLPGETPAYRRRQIAFSIIGQCLFYRIADDIVEMMISEDERELFSIERLAEHITEFTLAAITSTTKKSSPTNHTVPSMPVVKSSAGT